MSDTTVTTTTGLTGAGGGDKIRITGMATGLDVDALVTKMLTSDQFKVGQEQVKLQSMQWKQTAYQDIITGIKDFQNQYFNLSNMSSMVTRDANYNAFTATSNDSTIVSATANSNAIEGNYNVTVTNLATKATILSTELTGKDETTTLSSLGITSSDKFTIKVDDGTSYDVIPSNDDTISSFLNKVNEQTKGLVSGYFDEVSSKIILQRNDTGSSHKIQVINSDLSKNIGLTNGTDNSTDTLGSDANFSITSPSGGVKNITQATNSVTLNGITFTLAGKTGSSTTVSIKADADTTFNLIKGFIDKYNAIVDKVQGELSEKKSLDYKPLSDEQKKQMSSTDITNWETKAKEGLLSNDPILTDMMNSLRNAFFDKIGGVSLSFGKNIGLDTTSDWKKGGRIEFVDGGEATLKSVISNNRQQFTDLFTKVSYSTDSTEKYNNEGIFQRVNSILQDYVGRTGTSLNTAKLTSIANLQDDYSLTGSGSGNTLPDQMFRQNLYIKQLTSKMSNDKEKYYQQFSKLETAMETLNNQSSWLSQQLSQ